MIGGASVETTGFNPCRKQGREYVWACEQASQGAGCLNSGGSHSTMRGKESPLTLHYKAFNFLSVRFKVLKLSTKHPSPLCQSNLSSSPGHEEGREAKGTQGERSQQQRPILEITIVSILSNQ